MIFGAPDVLAIEAELASAEGKWFLGRFRLFIQGRAFGDWDDTADLATGARASRLFLRATAERTRPDLEERSAEEVFFELYGKHAGPKATSRGSWNRSPYVLDEIGESSLRDRIAVVVMRRRDGFDRVITHDWRTETCFESIIPPRICDSVVDAYSRWVESLGADAEPR